MSKTNWAKLWDCTQYMVEMKLGDLYVHTESGGIRIVPCSECTVPWSLTPLTVIIALDPHLFISTILARFRCREFLITVVSLAVDVPRDHHPMKGYPCEPRIWCLGAKTKLQNDSQISAFELNIRYCQWAWRWAPTRKGNAHVIKSKYAWRRERKEWEWRGVKDCWLKERGTRRMATWGSAVAESERPR
jgi:hypothetical protein